MITRTVGAVLALAVVGIVGLWAAHWWRQFEAASPPQKERLTEVWPKKVQPPKGWVWIDTRNGFTVWAPPGTRYSPGHGVDWLAGTFEGTNFSFSYYLGNFPQNLHEKNDPPFAETPVEIDGRHGIVQRAELAADRVKDGRRYYSRLLLKDAIPSGQWTALDLYGTAATPQARDEMEDIWRTIRFDSREVKAPPSGVLP